MKNPLNKKGFTLLETIVAISILATVLPVIGSFTNAFGSVANVSKSLVENYAKDENDQFLKDLVGSASSVTVATDKEIAFLSNKYNAGETFASSFDGSTKRLTVTKNSSPVMIVPNVDNVKISYFTKDKDTMALTAIADADLPTLLNKISYIRFTITQNGKDRVLETRVWNVS